MWIQITFKSTLMNRTWICPGLDLTRFSKYTFFLPEIPNTDESSMFSRCWTISPLDRDGEREIVGKQSGLASSADKDRAGISENRYYVGCMSLFRPRTLDADFRLHVQTVGGKEEGLQLLWCYCEGASLQPVSQLYYLVQFWFYSCMRFCLLVLSLLSFCALFWLFSSSRHFCFASFWSCFRSHNGSRNVPMIP